MLFTKLTPGEKRAKFRAGLTSGRMLRFPGAFFPLLAMHFERAGFDGVYISGGALSAALGLPDIGLTTLTEVAATGNQIARVTDLPVLIDADTGFGEAMSAARTVGILEDQGVAGCHIEDQVAPKRCGHLDNKSVVEIPVMVQRIRAAVSGRRDPNFIVVARTDARANEGLDKAIDRMKAYADAGADMIFAEAVTDLSMYAKFKAAAQVPILANITEFGQTPLYTKEELASAGVDIVLYCCAAYRAMNAAALKVYQTIRAEGTQRDVVSMMQTRAQLYEFLGYGEYERKLDKLFAQEKQS